MHMFLLLSLLILAINAEWYDIIPTEVFTAPFSNYDYNNFACNGHWKNEMFMKPPYITMNGSSITANVTASATQSRACIYQHTQNTCRMFLGTNGMVQLEFDYEITGDRWSNWFSFWVNSAQWGRWVQDCELDPLEEMNQVLAHNFAGLGHQVKFKTENQFRGHVSLRSQETGAQATDCAFGSSTCDFSGDYATQKFRSSTAAGIRNKQIVHHLAIDYWKTWLPSSLKISSIRIFGQGDFQRMCPSARPLRLDETEKYKLPSSEQIILFHRQAKNETKVRTSKKRILV